METATALVAAGSAFGLSYLIGRSLAAPVLLVALGGLLSGAGFAILYFVSTVTVGHFMPHIFEPWLLGVHFIALIAVAPLGGAVIAALTLRYVEHSEAARLPF